MRQVCGLDVYKYSVFVCILNENGVVFNLQKLKLKYLAVVLYRRNLPVIICSRHSLKTSQPLFAGNDDPRFPDVIDQEPNWRRMGIFDLM